MQTTSANAYKLLSKAWLLEPGEIHARRCRAEFPLGFPPVTLLFSHTELSVNQTNPPESGGFASPLHQCSRGTHYCQLSCGETLPGAEHSQEGGYCGTAESKLEMQTLLFHIIQLTAGFGKTAQRQFLGIFQKMVHSKGCFPNSKMDDVMSTIIFFLTVYPKTPPESLEPSQHYSCHIHLPFAAGSTRLGVGGQDMHYFRLFDLNTHRENYNYDPGSHSQKLTLEMAWSLSSIFQSFVVIPCVSCVLEICFHFGLK